MEEQPLLGDDIYEVEEIVGMKKLEGVWLYRVRWKGYGSHSDTWEPEQNLLLCRDMIEEHKTKLAERASRRQARETAHHLHGEKILSENLALVNEQPPKICCQPPSGAEEFWKDVAEGKALSLEEDMYSRVKGRAAKRALKLGSAADGGKKRKLCVLQTLSQSFDNSMKNCSGVVKRADVGRPHPVGSYLAKLRMSRQQQPVEVTHPSVKDKTDVIKQEALTEDFHERLRWHIDDPEQACAEERGRTDDELSEVTRCILRGDCKQLPPLLKSLGRTWEENDTSSLRLSIAAVSKNDSQAVGALADADVNLNVASSDGTTALMFAAQNGQSDVVLELLKSGVLTDLQNAKGETALMLACSGGFVEIARHLLHYGANFSTVNSLGMSALRLAKVGGHSDIQELLTYQLARLTAAFELEVRATVSDTAHIMHAVFPLHCFSLNEQADFTINFNHESQPFTPGVGYLLFVAHASISTEGVQCRLYGPCSVESVTLNDAKQPPLTEEANFVFSFCPLSDGLNTVVISTAHNPKSMVKLLVCAYKAVLNPDARP